MNKTATAIISAVSAAATVMLAQNLMTNKGKVKRTLKNAVDKSTDYVSEAIDKGSDYISNATSNASDYLKQTNMFK